MTVKLEDFSLRHFIPQFREFNTETKDNRERLIPYFWWARATDFARFRFILSGLIMEKLSRIMRDLPYNKKFIIRKNDAFAGIIGIDDVSQNATRAEIWYFVTQQNEGHRIMPDALRQIEYFAQTKSIASIYARTARNNKKSQHMLARNGYEHYYPIKRGKEDYNKLMWYKSLNDKVIEK
ncbi:MAG: GNAT family N-acetyltransferase [Alphaproteobacteria bacterium]|nr:GNAT family N-acetyltransferase [Alphaproteobacteria bacterium]